MNNLSGQQLGNYRLVRLLGQGGFADVYLGEHVFLKTHAAIKVLHTQVTPENMGSFVAEAQNIARLHHPHIIRVLDFGVENNMPFLVMDYAPKGTLRQRHPRGSRLPLWMVVGYVRQIADALNYAHSQRLIHRDIKPENMLLGPNDEILISDFGIATMAQSSHYQITQDVVGTVSYMAPEQIQGKPRPVSDEYALAITIYEWLTGSCPFQGSFTEIATQHVFAQPAPLREKLPGISPDVEQVIMMALAKDPLQRFANLKAFAIALEQASGVTPDLSSDSLTFIPPGRSGPTLTPVLSQGELLTDISAGGPAKNPTPVVLPAGEVATRLPTPTPVPPATTGASASRPRSRVSRRMFIGGAGLLVVLSSGALAWYGSAFLRSYANHGGFTPTIPAHVATPVTPVATATATPTATPSPTPSPTPTQPPPTPTQPPPTPTPQPTSPPVSPALVTYQGPSKMYTVSWSPNGTKIASAGLGPNIEVWSATTGSDYFKCYSGSSIIYSTAWSPNGSYLVSGHDDGSIQFWDGSSGNHLFSISAHSRQVNSVAWSPDGSKVVSGSGDKTAKIWDVTTGNLLLTYTNHTSYVNTVSWSHNGNLIASGGGGGTVHVWSSSTGSDSYIYGGHSSVILATAWSLDDSRIVSVSQDTTGRVWSSTDGTTYVIYSGHNDYIVAVAWSPDGSYIASGSKDNTVQVWGAASGHRYHLYNGHSNEVEGVAWSPDSSKVVSASDDTTVQVWKAVS